MTKAEAVNWIINISADIGKIEHQDLWHYEQALDEIREMLEAEPERKIGKWEVLDIRDYAQRHTGRKVGKCPFCGYLTGEFRRWREAYHELTNFCPACGVKMEKRDE